jgi:hypothetical protein
MNWIRIMYIEMEIGSMGEIEGSRYKKRSDLLLFFILLISQIYLANLYYFHLNWILCW